MSDFINQLKLDFQFLVLDLEELFFAWVCDLLLLVPAYILIYFFPGYSTDIVALTVCLVILLNGVFLLPRTIFRDWHNNWVFQASAAGMAPQHYFLAKIITGFCSLFSSTYIFFLFLHILFYREAWWLTGGTLVLFLMVPAFTLVLILSSFISAGESRILPLVLAAPPLLPAMVGGYILFHNLGEQVALNRAWVYWLGSYNLIFLVAGWFLSEYFWEEFYR